MSVRTLCVSARLAIQDRGARTLQLDVVLTTRVLMAVPVNLLAPPTAVTAHQDGTG